MNANGQRNDVWKPVRPFKKITRKKNLSGFQRDLAGEKHTQSGSVGSGLLTVLRRLGMIEVLWHNGIQHNRRLTWKPR
jgi:hypothetical protein